MTFQLEFVQIRYFLESIKLIFSVDKSSSGKNKPSGDDSISPFQAFINTLGANIGNGSLAGMGMAIYSGGPGAIVWMISLASFTVVLRFSEVLLGSYVRYEDKNGEINGGPMVYMSFLPGGKLWSYFFAIMSLAYMFVGGNIAQSHAVGLVIARSVGVSEFITAFFVFAFVAYVFLGGTQRIVKFLEKLVPLKVVFFLITAVIILGYHYQSIPHALYLMGYFALTPGAVAGGIAGFALQESISAGFQQGTFASEAGLGNAAIAFGSSRGGDPVKSAVLSMLGVFINTHVVCFLVFLSVMASGVWNNGEASSALIVSTYETVYGKFGGWIVMFLVINFAMSVLVASVYNGKRCWQFIFSGRFKPLFGLLYAIAAFFGTWMAVEMVWSLNNLVNATLLVVNCLGLLWSFKTIKKEFGSYARKQAAR